MTNQVLALKWRPRNFSEVIGQPHVVQALSNGLDNNRLHHAFLFTGTRGVGKTTLARIFAKSLNCEEGVSSKPCGVCSICQEVDSGRFVDLIEIDAASRTRVEDTREILDNVQYAPTRGRYKIYLIDEVHMLSNSSFNALLKTLEEPPSHVKFLLATTDPQKLPITVLSRCLRFQLKKISQNEILGQLEKLLTLENIPYERDALSLIARAGEGSMRDALSLLDQAIAYTGSNIEFSAIKEMLGVIDNEFVLQVLCALSEKNAESVLAVTAHLKNFGLDYKMLFEELITAFHELTLLQINPEYKRSDNEEFAELASHFTPEDLQLFYQISLHARNDLHLHPNSELGFEMALLRMVLFAPSAPLTVNHENKPASLEADTSLKEGKKKAAPKLSDLTPSAKPVISPQNIEAEPAKVTKVAEESSQEEQSPYAKKDYENNSDFSLVMESSENRQESQESSPNSTRYALVGEMPIDTTSVSETSSEELQGAGNVESTFLDDDVASKEGGENSDNECSSREIASQADLIAPINSSSEETLSDELPSEGKKRETFSKSSNYQLLEDSPANLKEGRESTLELGITNNEEWLSFLLTLKLDSVMSGIAHSLVFSHFEGNQLVLERPKDVASFSIDQAEAYLAKEISEALGRNIQCRIEYVDTLDEENLHERVERIDEERQQEALNRLSQDPVVRYLDERYGARILEKTIKLT